LPYTGRHIAVIAAGKSPLFEIGVTEVITGGELVVSGQTTMVGDFTIVITGTDSGGNIVTKEFVVKIEPYEVPNASDVVTSNPLETVTTRLTGNASSPAVSVTLKTDVTPADAEEAMKYSGTRFEVQAAVSGNGGFRLTGGKFLLSGNRGAFGDGVPLELTGTMTGKNTGNATIESVSYVVGVKRYTQRIGLNLASTQVIDETASSGGSSGGGCDAGSGFLLLALAGLALKLRKKP
jgi:hypothetical protein